MGLTSQGVVNGPKVAASGSVRGPENLGFSLLSS